MKKTMVYVAVLFGTLILFPACSKNAKDNLSRSTTAVPDQIINAKVVPGQTYILNVASSGDLSISKQAIHYLVSETGIGEINGSVIYRYSPASGFTGTDEVLLTHRSEISASSNDGCNYGNTHMSSRTTSIAVKIAVAY